MAADLRSRSTIMALDVAEGNIVKLTLEQRIFGQDAQNSWYFQARGDASSNDLQDQFLGTPFVFLQDATSRDLTFVRCTVSDVFPGTAPRFQGPEIDGVTNTGTIDDDSDVSFEAGCISWTTELRGQGNRGRSYIAGMSHTMLTNGLLTGDEVNLLGQFAQQMINNFTFDGISAGNWLMLLWRTNLQRVPTVLGQTELNIVNPISRYVEYKPVFTYPSNNRAVPLNPLAGLPIRAYSVGNRARSVRRRGIGVSITRSHRVPRNS